MKKLLFILLYLSNSLVYVSATHNRAGEITLRQISDYTYEIIIHTFTYTLSAADRNQLDVQWGDNTTSVAPRFYKTTLPNFYYFNKYRATHTFPGPGTYTIVVQDPNRNFGVQNIPNSVNVIFSIKTTITINPAIGHNNTPVLLNPPIDKAALGQVFIHNPAAYDPDGDSLSYQLTVCTEENGIPIEGYTLPRASDTLYIDSRSGDLVWDAPVDTGIYNIAIKIMEWRNGVIIGSINRDMQIEVHKTSNNPPKNSPLHNFCVEAGTLIEYDIISTDEDNDELTQTATGGPFEFSDSPATFTLITNGMGYSASRFTWQTDCEHVRDQPYTVVVKAEDKYRDVNLVAINNFNIKVIGSAPEGLKTMPTSNSIRLDWNSCHCPNVTGYQVYRREGLSGYMPDSCQNGIPPSTGYILAGETLSRTDTAFIDNNRGTGLLQGNKYCYMVVAVFNKTTLGFPSSEVCDVLVPGTPAMINTSVTSVDTDGSVYLAWAKPRALDTIPSAGPFEYRIYRSADMWGNFFEQLDTVIKTADLNDTTLTDYPLNTIRFPYSYKLELYNDNPPLNRFLIGRQEVVSTTYIDVVPGDNENTLNIMKNVPWINTQYIIYRQRENSSEFDSIGYTESDIYNDNMLANNKEYCYQAKSIGWRQVDGTIYQSINYSHVNCGTPIDTFPPCPPQLIINSVCDSLYNELIWTNPNHYCADDVVKYRIYYSPQKDGIPQLFDSTRSASDTTYLHSPAGTLAGCYIVTAVDSFNNESEFSLSLKGCVPNCLDYELPNVFSPNGDGINDYLRPTKNVFVEKVDVKIFNRWGMLIFETSDPEINWDGKHMRTNDLVSPGVYYYIADVYDTFTDMIVKTLVGFVYVFTEPGADNPPRE